jgi:glycosyltransferase involved in cell wall biosynthesis
MSRIALVAPYAWAALSGQEGYVGGAEIQLARLARVLAARGHDVWMIVCDFGQEARVSIDGVNVERAYRPFGGVPGLRFFHPRWTGIAAALDRVRPDVVYQRTAGVLTGQCALWAKANGRRFVFACAHDFDTLPRSPFLANPRDRFFYRWGLRHADTVLAQSADQVRALKANHGIDAVRVRNVVDVPPAARPEAPADRVLWLGTLKADKRPEWVLEAARALPGVPFTIAGGPPPPPMPDDAVRALSSEAAGIPNIELTGAVPAPRVPELLRKAAMFAHTSPAEGFPNTLLEAWAYGVPSVSVVDPDGAVAHGGAGVLARDRDDFVQQIRDLMYDPARLRALGAAARQYVLRHHAPEAIGQAFEDALDLGPRAADPARLTARARS